VPSLGATYGRGAATTAQWDLQNSQCVVVMGSNMAENHPVAFRFVLAAKERGATIIHADPRFTRTSALADIYAPVRAGSDVAFLGGLIRYILDSERWHTEPFFKEYALAYTNLATVISPDFKDASELDGLFSGWEPDQRAYDVTSWQYQGETVPSALAEHYTKTTEPFSEKVGRLESGPPPSDPSLQDPNCVYQILKRHYAAYTPDMVERVTG
jgi:formate dehydrogenase major subunit